jgi:uncharacterized protein YggT (Ycf19 family)
MKLVTLSSPYALTRESSLSMLVHEGLRALAVLTPVVLYGVTLIVLLRLAFQLVGSDSTSIAQSIMRISTPLVSPFADFRPLVADLLALLTAGLVGGLTTALLQTLRTTEEEVT